MTQPHAVASRWLVSARFDLGILLVPMVASLVSLVTLYGRGADVPLWAYLLLIVAFDVAHVWATTLVTYFDREVLRSRRLLLFLPVPLFLGLTYRLHAHSPTLFWTLLAYVAIYHFIKQQYGFIALYKARAGEGERLDYYLDKWTLWAGALGPVLIWHASPARQFDWFNAGEFFIAEIDPAFTGDIVAVMAVFAVVYVGRQVKLWSTGHFNVGKNLWMACSWMSWSVGIGLADHPLVSAAFLNLFHGIPFIAIVWHRCNKRWQGTTGGPSPFVAWVSQRRRWLLFYLVALVPAVFEETLWDGFVWQQYLPSLLSFEMPELSPTALSVWVAVLSLPQIMHYFLDAWIWRLDGSNPDLHAALDMKRG